MSLLTDRKIKYLEPGKSRQIVWDNGGFGIQIAPDGEKSFILEYRFNEMTKQIPLGIYPEVSLETAKRQAIKAFGMIIQGVDPEEKGLPEPGDSKVGSSAPQKQAMDQIKEMASSALGQFKEKASETLDEIKTSETLGKLKERAAAKLDQIKQRVEKKVNPSHVKPKPPENKVVPIKKKEEPSAPEAPPPERKRKTPSLKDGFGRILDKGELKTLWLGLANSDMPPSHQLAMKLLMLTSQRYQEVGQARWADFDMVSKWWTIPGEFTPNGKKHKVPLSNLALEILRKVKELAGMAGVLFPVPGSVTPMDPKTLAEDLQKAQLRFGLKPFTLEDLQNSMVCQMIDNGIEERILYQLLNQEPPEELPDSGKKITDRDLRASVEKLEKQLPKTY